MSHRNFVKLGVVGLFALVSLTGCNLVGSTEVAENTYEVTDRVSRLELDSGAGEVVITAAEGPVKVTEELRFTNDRPKVAHEVIDGSLRLINAGCDEGRTCSVNYFIQAPSTVAVVVKTKAGAIDVTGISDSVDLTTLAGSIKATDLNSTKVRARSSAGSIDISISRVPDDVDVETSAGSVRVTVPGGTPYAVNASTSVGKLQVNVDEDPTSPHKIRARSSAGQVLVRTT